MNTFPHLSGSQYDLDTFSRHDPVKFLLVPKMIGSGGFFVKTTRVIFLAAWHFQKRAQVDLRATWQDADVDGAKGTMERVAAHEFGHFLKLSTREPTYQSLPDAEKRGHDDDKDPLFGTMLPNQYPPIPGSHRSTALMRAGPPLSGRWIRHEDWKTANDAGRKVTP